VGFERERGGSGAAAPCGGEESCRALWDTGARRLGSSTCSRCSCSVRGQGRTGCLLLPPAPHPQSGTSPGSCSACPVSTLHLLQEASSAGPSCRSESIQRAAAGESSPFSWRSRRAQRKGGAALILWQPSAQGHASAAARSRPRSCSGRSNGAVPRGRAQTRDGRTRGKAGCCLGRSRSGSKRA
jgi:hypothetical protein